MQSALSLIWTRLTVSIFYDDNHYTTGTFISHTNLDQLAGPIPYFKTNVFLIFD